MKDLMILGAIIVISVVVVGVLDALAIAVRKYKKQGRENETQRKLYKTRFSCKSLGLGSIQG